FVLDHMYMSLFTTLAWLLRLAFTFSLLAWVHPALLLLALFAAPSAVSAFTRPDIENKTWERVAPHQRLALHLFDLATTAPPGSSGTGRWRACAGPPRCGTRSPGRSLAPATSARWPSSSGEPTRPPPRC